MLCVSKKGYQSQQTVFLPVDLPLRGDFDNGKIMRLDLIEKNRHVWTLGAWFKDSFEVFLCLWAGCWEYYEYVSVGMDLRLRLPVFPCS